MAKLVTDPRGQTDNSVFNLSGLPSFGIHYIGGKLTFGDPDGDRVTFFGTDIGPPNSPGQLFLSAQSITGYEVILSDIRVVKVTGLDFTGSDLDEFLFGSDGEEVAARFFSGKDTLIGGNFGDFLYGHDGNDTIKGGAGNDSLFGGDGRDKLHGGIGRDYLEGGASADQFVFAAVSQSKPIGLGVQLDRIADFERGIDKINLKMIDADKLAAGNQKFDYIGSAAFSGEAGELRTIKSGGSRVVQVDTDGDGKSDMSIRVTGTDALKAGDFIL